MSINFFTNTHTHTHLFVYSILANFVTIATRRMRLLQNVMPEPEHINDLKVSILRRHGERGCIVWKIGAVSDAGIFQPRRQFIQLVQYQYGDPGLIISDCVQMRITRIDIWMRQQVLNHCHVSLINSDVKCANTLREQTVRLAL